MPKYLGHTCEARPLSPGYRWMAFDLDGVRAIGRDEEVTKGEAEAAARACIAVRRMAPAG